MPHYNFKVLCALRDNSCSTVLSNMDDFYIVDIPHDPKYDHICIIELKSMIDAYQKRDDLVKKCRRDILRCDVYPQSA